jgi:hypothetical protein
MSDMESQLAEKIALLEALADEQGDALLRAVARVTALEQALGAQGLLDHDDLARRVTALLADADETLELSPRHEAFRRWRRQQSGGEIPSDDQAASR